MNTAQSPDDDKVDITRMSLRNGGWIGYSDDAVFVDDEKRVKIHNTDISTVGLRIIEWDVAVMSTLLVILGGYVVATRNPLIGLAFALVGLLSLYRTYTKRHELIIHVENKPKPIRVYPTHPRECHKTLTDAFEMESIQR
jgi:hypothetical protein